VVACAEGGAPGEGPVDRTRLAIADGEEAPTLTEVVEIQRETAGETSYCSGVLIAPSVVLTARHCVGTTETRLGACGDAGFAPGQPSVVAKYTISLNLSGDVRAAVDATNANVRVPAATTDTICGNDLAVFVVPELAQFRNEPWFRAASPRLDRPVVPGEAYEAVGFGGTDDEGAGRGVRRRRANMAVSCAGAECGDASVGAGEWRGDYGVCRGDSGGPALDAQGRVIGIAARGRDGACEAPVYTSVFDLRAWVRDQVENASFQLGTDSPPWARRVAAAGDGDGKGDGGGPFGCTLGPAGSVGRGGPGAWLPATAAGGLAAARRRARRRRGGDGPSARGGPRDASPGALSPDALRPGVIAHDRRRIAGRPAEAPRQTGRAATAGRSAPLTAAGRRRAAHKTAGSPRRRPARPPPRAGPHNV
jgi:hypothetical protein